jgi:flagellin-like hook-associated protein FlgL
VGGWGTIYTTTQAALRQHGQELARLQEMAASGTRVQRASDAPIDAFRIMGLKADSAALQTYLANLGSVTDSLTIASSVLEQMTGLLARVRELLAQAVSGTYSGRDRAPVAGEVDALLEQLVLLANTKHLGRNLFGGSARATAAYTAEQEDGRIVRVAYAGSPQADAVPVGPNLDHAAVLVGDDLFRGRDRGSPQFLGPTGARAGAGTPSVRGDVYLSVTHEATVYLGASGIAPGESSAAGDTVLGSAHTLAVDAVARTLGLDGGPAVAFTAGDTDVRVASGSGDVVYVNVAALDPAFQGTVGIQATGRLSIDDGATSAAIDFADSNAAVTDSRTGRVLYVDSTGITRAGVEPVRIPGTFDLFGAVLNVRDILLNTRGLSEAAQIGLLEQAIGTFEEVLMNLSRSEVSVGARLGALATLGDTLENVKTFADEEAAGLENADIVLVATDLARRQSLYEMTLATASRLLQLSLLDFI